MVPPWGVLWIVVVLTRDGIVPTMFRNTFQSGFLSILYSVGSKPLQIWDKKVRLDSASSRPESMGLKFSIGVNDWCYRKSFRELLF